MRSLAIVLPELLPFPPTHGGAVEHWVDEACQHLNPTLFDVTVCARPAEVAAPGHITTVGIPWTRTEKLFQRIKDGVTWRNPLRYVGKLQNVWSYGKRAMASVHSHDVIYIQNEPNFLLFLKPRPAQKVVLHMHNDHLASKLFRPLYRRLLSRADLVVFVSECLRASASTIYPEHASRFVVAHNATNTDVFQPYDQATCHSKLSDVLPTEVLQAPWVLYVGRLVEVKGVHVLIEAFKQVLARQPNAKLVICGSSFFEGASTSPYERHLVELASPIREAIVFTGFLPHDKLRYLYAAADVVAFPPLWDEPFGLVMIETMASETCLVATSRGAIPEVLIDRQNGLLVPAGDVKALTKALAEVLNDPALRENLAKAGRQTVLARYRWPDLGQRLSTLLNAV